MNLLGFCMELHVIYDNWDLVFPLDKEIRSITNSLPFSVVHFKSKNIFPYVFLFVFFFLLFLDRFCLYLFLAVNMKLTQKKTSLQEIEEKSKENLNLLSCFVHFFLDIMCLFFDFSFHFYSFSNLF